MKLRYISPLVLLPVFFSLHRYLLYSDLVAWSAALGVCAEYIAISLLLYFLLVRLSGKHGSASITVTALLAFQFFFGEFRSACMASPSLEGLARYRYFLPLSFIVLLAVILIIRSVKDLSKLAGFINLVLVIWILMDVGNLWPRSATNDGTYAIQRIAFDERMRQPLEKEKERPDIYHLVFDSHPGAGLLHHIGAEDPIGLDSNLRARGFQVANDCRSNYNATPLSISSIYNMGHVTDLIPMTKPTAKNFAEALHDIEHAFIPRWFVASGYRFVNLSMFRILGEEPVIKGDFIVLSPREMLLHPTFTSSILHDLRWHLVESKNGFDSFTRDRKFLPFKRFNQMVQEGISRAIDRTDRKPVFLYAHLYLPHPPIFYDAAGNDIPEDSAVDIRFVTRTKNFLGYLAYTDKYILRVVDSIHQKDPSAVILIQSDHGYRDLGEKVPLTDWHLNYFAVNIPGKQVKGLDSMTNINTFPLVLNELFGLNWPKQKDSLVITR